MDTEPIAVALKFGFLAVLYLFLLWVARSALRELRRTTAPAPEATGVHPIGPGGRAAATDAWLVAVTGGGLERRRAVRPLRRALDRALGRRRRADRGPLSPRASTRVSTLAGRSYYVEDMNSTNGTFLNGGRLDGRGRAQGPRRDADRRHGAPIRARRPRDGADVASVARAGVPIRHGTAAKRERGLLLRARAAVRGRRRDGRRAGRRGRLAHRRRVVRAGAERARSRPRPTCGRSPRTANARIHRLAQADASRSGMGTTLTAALVEDDEVELRPRRRQPRVPVARRRAEAPHLGPLAGRGASPPGPAHRRAGRGPPAALDHHPGARARAARSRSTR